MIFYWIEEFSFKIKPLYLLFRNHSYMIRPDYQPYKMRICISLLVFLLLLLSVQFIHGQVVGFEVVGPFSGCRPFTVSFKNTSDATNTESFTWNFGDGSPEETYPASNAGETIEHIFDNPWIYAAGYEPGQHEVRLTLVPTSGTPKIEIQIIEEYFVDIPQAQASAQVLCGGSVIFSNLSDFGITPGARTTIWDFGDGNYQTAGTEDITYTYSFAADSTYTVKMTDINQCGTDSISLQVAIYHTDNQINVLPGLTACVNNGISFSNGGQKDQMTYTWDFADGDTTNDSSPVHEYESDGIYLITMAVGIPGGQECSDTVTTTVTVLEGPKASFTMDYDTTCDQADLSVINMSMGGQDTRSWDYG